MKLSPLAISNLLLATPVASFAPVATTFVHKTANSPSFLQTSLFGNPGSFDFTQELSGKGTLKISFDTPEEGPPKEVPVIPLYEALPGIGLPEGIDEPEKLVHGFTKSVVLNIPNTIARNETLNLLLGQEKDNSQATFDDIAKCVVEQLGLGTGIPENMKDSYKFFGNGDSAENLKLLLKSNPFMAPALQLREDCKPGFEIKSYDPAGFKEPTLYQTIIGELAGVGRRVNIQFNSNMDRIEGFQMYDDVTGNQKRMDDVDIDLVASAAIYNMFAFAQAVHAAIHVLHYVYTSAFQVASGDAEFEPMIQWANDYALHIPEKYLQVGVLLINDRQFTFDDPPFLKGFGPDSSITGGEGLGFRQIVGADAPIRGVIKKMFQDWAKNPSADGFYMDNMMKNTNITTENMKSAGILTEFRKHFELSKEFAAGTCDALQETDSEKFNAAQENLKQYLKNCGELEESGLTSINQWVEMMAVTGAMHGSTLSFTRVLLKPEVMRWREKENDKWNLADKALIGGTLGTMYGVDDGTHAAEGGCKNSRVVMSKSKLSGDESKLLQEALDKFNERATTLKNDYKDELIKNPKFNDYGWILSDWCPDSFDGKQLTIATYI